MAIAEALLKSHSYTKYRQLVSGLLLQGLSSGNDQSEALTKYSLLNQTRMDRLDKKMVVSEENIQKLLILKKQYIWLVLSEGWCGDAAQMLPIFNKMAAFSQHIELKIAFRDGNESLMQLFLTNGARSIPKLIVLEKNTGEVLGHWGPRPKGASELIRSYRLQYGAIDDTAKIELQLWYLHDKGTTTQKEIIEKMLLLDN